MLFYVSYDCNRANVWYEGDLAVIKRKRKEIFMKKIIFTVFSILIILTTIFFIAIGTVRDSRYYILILVYIIVYKIILSFTNRSKKK